MTIDEIIAGMTEAQREAVAGLMDGVGILPAGLCYCLEKKLITVKRHGPDWSIYSARLTPLGLSVRARLEEQSNG